VHHRSSNSSVARHCDDQVRSKVHSKVSFEKIRRSAPINEYDSARLHPGHLWAQRNRVDLQEVQPDFISRSHLKVVQQDKRMKRVPNGNDCSRALMLSRRRRSASSSSNSYRNNSYSSEGRCSNNNNEVARPLQPITARDTDSRKVEPSDNQKKRHRQSRDNFVATKRAAPERKTPEPLLFSRASLFRRFSCDAAIVQNARAPA